LCNGWSPGLRHWEFFLAQLFLSRYDPGLQIPFQISTEDERVDYLKLVAQVMVCVCLVPSELKNKQIFLAVLESENQIEHQKVVQC
jgi:hypothetical protein